MDAQEINHAKKWKYAKGEFERRFLLKKRTVFLDTLPYKEITDKYLENTKLRLRKVVNEELTQYKLTKKLPVHSQGLNIQWVSTIYISQEEYDIFLKLPGEIIEKRRYYYQAETPEIIGIDEICLNQGQSTIWIAEVELEERQESAYTLPLAYDREITNDKDYIGSVLAKHYLGK